MMTGTNIFQLFEGGGGGGTFELTKNSLLTFGALFRAEIARIVFFTP